MKFQIDVRRVEDVVSDLQGNRITLESNCNVVSSVSRNLDCLSRSGSQVRSRLRSILRDMERERDLLDDMQNSLSEIVTVYRTYENKIAYGKGVRATWTNAIPGAEYDTPDGKEKDGNFQWEKVLNECLTVIGGFGLPGHLVKVIGKFLTGGSVDEKDWFELTNFINKFIGEGASAVSKGGTRADWKDYILGLNDGLSGLTDNGTSFGDVFKTSWKKSFVDDLGFKGAATTADKVKVGTAWAGHLLTLLGNGIENNEEHGGMTGRAWAETGIETATDIVLGAAAGALVSAGAAALVGAGVITGAPAILVAGATGVVVWAANGVCKWVTGKIWGEERDLGEVLADGFCDAGEKAVEVVKDAGNAIKDGVQKAGEAIQNGLSSAWSGICGAFA